MIEGTHNGPVARRRNYAAAPAAVVLCALSAATALATGSHPITITAGDGGSATPAGLTPVSNHGDLTVLVTPATGRHVSDVIVDGVSVGPVTSYTFTDVVTSHTLDAVFHVPWATEVVSYGAGTNSWTQPNVHWQYAQTSTGEPARTTSYGLHDITMFQQPWMTNQLVSIGSGGQLTVTFDHPIQNDPHNPYGIDLLVFGNAMFTLDGGLAGAPHEEPGMISLSQDGTNWHHVTSAQADSLYPSLGFTDTPSAQNANGGTQPTSFVSPVQPGINWTNASYAELVALYDGAGGGCGVDIGEVGLEWVQYVRVWQPEGDDWSTEVDAFSDVAPSLERRLAIDCDHGSCTPSAGAYGLTSGQSVTSTVAGAVQPLSSGTRTACVGWGGSGSVPAAGTGTVARFTMTVDSSLTWNWSTQHLITASCSTGGTLSTTGNWANAGDALAVSAAASNGFVFAGWTGDTAGNTNGTTIVLPSDQPRHVTATFTAAPAVPPEVTTWLDAYGLTNVNAWEELSHDRDGDGHTGQQEFAAGTDPTEPDSVLRIIRWQRTGGSNAITWLGGPHGSPAPFSAWFATNITGPWNLIGDAFAKSPTGTNELAHVAPASEMLFYRVTVTANEGTP